MIPLSRIIIPERIHLNIALKSKKKILEYIAATAAKTYPGILEEGIFNALIARERLGSTTLPHGIAIPHARLTGLYEPFGLFVRLKEPVQFSDAPDNEISLVFALFVPIEANAQHLTLLANIVETLKDTVIRHEIRHSTQPQQVYDLLCQHTL